jgi:hypothetical protein
MRRMIFPVYALVAVLALAVPGCGQRPIELEAEREPAPASTNQPQSPGEIVEETGSGFPTDRGGALLAEVLSPSGKGRSNSAAVMSPHRQLARDPEPPLSPLSLGDAPLPHPALEKPLKLQRPAEIPDGPPLVDRLASPPLPQKQPLPAGARLRVPSPDVNQPPPLPYLGQPKPDRAPLDDPTVDASLALALTLSPPLRMMPAPFIRLFLPNPFEHRDTGRLRQPLEESAMPLATTPRTPPKP